MIIIGAGLAGLLAGNMLAHRKPTVHEAQPALPNNHSAVLRFRSGVVGDVTGIPFKKVTMVKCVLPWRNPVADALAYSFKNTGFYKSDRSITSGTVVGDRFIAPPNLIEKLAERCTIEVDKPATAGSLKLMAQDRVPIVSTMPMPMLMEILDYPRHKDMQFSYTPGINIRAAVRKCDAYVSIIVPSPQHEFSRISLTGNELIIEFPGIDGDMDAMFVRTQAHRAAEMLGINSHDLENITFKKQKYAKILPIDEDARRDFIYWASSTHNIYSLGRYATWRPKLLLDDLVQDIRLIDGWVQRNDKYSLARFR